MVELNTAVRLVANDATEFDCTPRTEQTEQPDSTLVFKNLAQIIEVKALERMFSVVYARTVKFDQLLDKVNCDRAGKELLSQRGFVPLSSLLNKQLTALMTTTNEGKRLFAVAQLIFGFEGEVITSLSAIALRMGIPATEVKQAIIRLKARLQTQIMRQLIERILDDIICELKQTGFFLEPTLNSTRVRSANAASNTSLSAWSVQVSRVEGLIPELVQDLKAKVGVYSTINVVCNRICREDEIAYQLALSLSHAGKKVLLVTHSRLLAQYLRKRHSSEEECFAPDIGSLSISTFHSLCHGAATEAGLKIPKHRNSRVFNETFPELLLEAVHLSSEYRFDGIIICEGHCFGPNIWRALKHCLRDRSKDPYVYFYDPILLNFNRLSIMPAAADTVDLRSSMPESHNIAESHHTLELYESESSAELCRTVELVVDDLISAGYSALDIVILSIGSEKNTFRFKLKSGIRVCQQLSKSQNRPSLMHTSLFQFRAMKARIVIVIDIDQSIEKLSDWKMQYLCYLLYGRAMEKMVLIGSKKLIAKILPPEASLLAATGSILSGDS